MGQSEGVSGFLQPLLAGPAAWCPLLGVRRLPQRYASRRLRGRRWWRRIRIEMAVALWDWFHTAIELKAGEDEGMGTLGVAGIHNADPEVPEILGLLRLDIGNAVWAELVDHAVVVVSRDQLP